MPRPIKLKLVIKVLEEMGFFFVTQKGSHAKYRKLGDPVRNVTIKTSKKEIPYGTFQSILIQSRLNKSNFEKRKK